MERRCTAQKSDFRFKPSLEETSIMEQITEAKGKSSGLKNGKMGRKSSKTNLNFRNKITHIYKLRRWLPWPLRNRVLLFSCDFILALMYPWHLWGWTHLLTEHNNKRKVRIAHVLRPLGFSTSHQASIWLLFIFMWANNKTPNPTIADTWRAILIWLLFYLKLYQLWSETNSNCLYLQEGQVEEDCQLRLHPGADN